MLERHEKLADIEREVILQRLCSFNFNITHTAKSLGIGIRTLQRKLLKYGVPKQEVVGLPVPVRREVIKQFLIGEIT